MLKRILLLAAVPAMLASAASTHRLATFNLRVYAVSDTEGKCWEIRGPKCSDVILKYGFDVVGLQEMSAPAKGYYNPQTGRTPLDDMRAWLPGYEMLSWDRDGDKNMEYVSIAYKSDKYDEVESGSFYIGPTPDKPSDGWDTVTEQYRRRLGWVKLKDKDTGEVFLFAATHTSDGSSIDGPYGSQLISRKLKEIADGLPIMMVGDLNTSRKEIYRKGIKAYHASFYDAGLDTPADKNYSVPTENPSVDWTYQGFHPASDATYTTGSELDYHFYRGMTVTGRHIVTDEFTYNGVQYTPSDHFPVYVDVELAPEQPKSYYVDCNAADGGDGSISMPFRTISQAVAHTAIDDVVYVAAGTYNESVSPKRTISILGGYSSDFSEVEGTSVIDGNGLEYSPIYASEDISLTLKDLTVRGYKSPDKERDGAVLFKGSSLHMERMVIEDNTAVGYGAGLSIINAASTRDCDCNNITAIDCVFRNNSSKLHGGAMAVSFYDTMVVDGCTFDGNKSNNNGSAIYARFGKSEVKAKRIWFTNAKALVTNSSFVNNVAGRSGTVVVEDNMPNVAFNVVNSTFAANSIDCTSGTDAQRKAVGGAAIRATLANVPETPTLDGVESSVLNIGHVTIIGNHANSDKPSVFQAAAVNVTGGTTRILNSVIAANTTNGEGACADVTVSETFLETESHNIFTAPSTVNFVLDKSSLAGSTAEDGTAAIAAMFDGSVADGKYRPQVVYAEGAPTPFVSYKSNMFGTTMAATVGKGDRMLEQEFDCDINRDGTIGSALATDQLRKPRNESTMPGAVEYSDEASLPSVDDGVSDPVTVEVIEGNIVRICAPMPIGKITAVDIAGRIVANVDAVGTAYDLDLSVLQPGVCIVTCCGRSYKLVL